MGFYNFYGRFLYRKKNKFTEIGQPIAETEMVYTPLKTAEYRQKQR